MQGLNALGIYTLFCHCQHGEIIEVFKTLNGYYDINSTQFLYHLHVTNASGQSMKLFKPHQPIKTFK